MLQFNLSLETLNFNFINSVRHNLPPESELFPDNAVDDTRIALDNFDNLC